MTKENAINEFIIYCTDKSNSQYIKQQIEQQQQSNVWATNSNKLPHFMISYVEKEYTNNGVDEISILHFFEKNKIPEIINITKEEYLLCKKAYFKK